MQKFVYFFVGFDFRRLLLWWAIARRMCFHVAYEKNIILWKEMSFNFCRLVISKRVLLRNNNVLHYYFVGSPRLPDIYFLNVDSYSWQMSDNSSSHEANENMLSCFYVFSMCKLFVKCYHLLSSMVFLQGYIQAFFL